MLTSIMSGMHDLFAQSSGLRTGRHQSRRVWKSEDHAHKSPTQCCCRDIHKFCSHVHTDGSAVGYYNVMKCLADRSRKHHDVHPLCVVRLQKTVAGSCAAEIDRVCSTVRPGNNALHKCLMKHQNDGATSAKCQGYLDMAELSEKTPNRNRVYASKRPGTEMVFKRVNATRIIPAQRANQTVFILKKKAPKMAPTVLSAAATTTKSKTPLPDSAKFIVRPVYLIVGIAGLSVFIIGIAIAVKRHRQERREANINSLIRQANYGAL